MNEIDDTGLFPLCLLKARYGDGWIAVDTADALIYDPGERRPQRRIDWLLDSDLYNEMSEDGDEARKFNAPNAPTWLAFGDTPAKAVANLRIKKEY